MGDQPDIGAITLADSEYHTPNKIDMLLGTEIYNEILKDGIIKDQLGVWWLKTHTWAGYYLVKSLQKIDRIGQQK